MWKIETNGGLGQRWQTPNSWEKGEGEKEDSELEFFLIGD